MFLSKESDKILKEALDLYAKEYCKTLPSDEELAGITFSKEFEIKMQKLINAQKKVYYYWINTVGKRVAIIITAIIIGLTATTFGVKAIREAVIEFITETFEKFTQITVEKDEPTTPTEFVKIKPEYIPDGFEVERDIYTEGLIYSIIYRDSDNRSITYTQQIPDNSGMDADTENSVLKTIYINSYEGIVYENKESYTLLFANENYYFSITSKIDVEELQKIAESIPIEIK